MVDLVISFLFSLLSFTPPPLSLPSPPRLTRLKQTSPKNNSTDLRKQCESILTGGRVLLLIVVKLEHRDMTSPSWIDLVSEEEEEGTQHSQNLIEPLPETEGSSTQLSTSPATTKRKGKTEEDETGDDPNPKRVHHEPTFHPMYDECAPKVTLLSNDGRKFCVEKQLLSTHRWVYYPSCHFPSLPLLSSILSAPFPVATCDSADL